MATRSYSANNNMQPDHISFQLPLTSSLLTKRANTHMVFEALCRHCSVSKYSPNTDNNIILILQDMIWYHKLYDSCKLINFFVGLICKFVKGEKKKRVSPVCQFCLVNVLGLKHSERQTLRKQKCQKLPNGVFKESWLWTLFSCQSSDNIDCKLKPTMLVDGFRIEGAEEDSGTA